MRDRNRIPMVLSRLGVLWGRYPDLRLGQLILNCFPSDNPKPLYMIEDAELISALESGYLTVEPASGRIQKKESHDRRQSDR
jgi:hypothetical protein